MKLPPSPLPDAPPPSVLVAARKALLAAQRATHAITPPELALWEMLFGVARTELVALAARLDLTDRIGDGARSASDLAAECEVHADSLFRAMRAMAAHGLFSLGDDGRFSNNALSRTLSKHAKRSMRDAALYFGSDSNLDAWRGLSASVASGESAFAARHGVSVWEWFEAHPEELATFANAMGRATALEAPTLAKLYPFGDFQTFCDVGGGSGTLASEVLLRNPALRCVLSDAPSVLERARELLAARGVLDRVTLAPGSFFDDVPAGCELYTMKNILHDWDDARSKKILGIVRRAMNPGAKLVLFEGLLDRHDDRPEATLADLQMFVVCDGRERSIDEFRVLLEATGFRLGRVFRGALNCAIEGIAQ